MYKAFFYSTLFFGVVPLLILFLKRKALSLNQAITPFVWLTAIASLYEFVGTGILKINTAYWFQLYSFLELTTLYYFFYRLFYSSHRKILRVFAAVLLLTYGASFLFWGENSLFILNAINQVPLTLFVFFFFVLWFKKLFDEAKIANPWREPIYYFVSGLAMYYSMTLLLFLWSSFFFTNGGFNKEYWLVNIIGAFILRTFLTLGVWNMKQI